MCVDNETHMMMKLTAGNDGGERDNDAESMQWLTQWWTASRRAGELMNAVSTVQVPDETQREPQRKEDEEEEIKEKQGSPEYEYPYNKHNYKTLLQKRRKTGWKET